MRHVIVTGGSRGLGLAVVAGLLAEGYAVSACSRNPSPALTALAATDAGVRLFWQSADMADPVAVENFIAAAVLWGQTVAGGGALYGLVNNAGRALSGVLATFPNVDTTSLLATNLTGPIVATRAFLRHLLPQLPTKSAGNAGENTSGGRIISISSIVAHTGYSGLAVYAATKAGLEGMTRALAREVGSRAITVNALAPGYLDTEMSADLSASQRQQIIRRTPLGRLGTAADVWPLLRFLLSDEAGFITGQTWIIDGGLTG